MFFSLSKMWRTLSAVTGSKYTWSAIGSDLCLSTSTDDASSRLVWTVAMFGLINTTSMPSSLRALMAWEPAMRVSGAAATA